jgi:hypothetical protein
MKLFIKNDLIITSSRDDIDIDIPGCTIKYVPDDTIVYSDNKRPTWSGLNIPEIASDTYKNKLELIQGDLKMIRVIDDIINILIENKINIDSLPKEVRDRLSKRDSLRKILK